MVLAILVGDLLLYVKSLKVKLKQDQEVYQVYRKCRKWLFIMNVRDSRDEDIQQIRTIQKKEEPGIKEKKVLHRSVDHTVR